MSYKMQQGNLLYDSKLANTVCSTARRWRVVKPPMLAMLDDQTLSSPLAEGRSTTRSQKITSRSHARRLGGVNGPLAKCLTTTVRRVQWGAVLYDCWSSKPG